MKNIYKPRASVKGGDAHTEDRQTDLIPLTQTTWAYTTPTAMPPAVHCLHWPKDCLWPTEADKERPEHPQSTPLSPALWFLSLSENSNPTLLPQPANLVMLKVRLCPTVKEPACVARVGINSYCSEPLNLLDCAQLCPVEVKLPSVLLKLIRSQNPQGGADFFLLVHRCESAGGHWEGSSALVWPPNLPLLPPVAEGLGRVSNWCPADIEQKWSVLHSL